MRDFINKHGIAVGAVLIVIAALVIYFVYLRNAGKVSPKAYFIDEETGEESVHLRTELPPLMGKGGKPTVVEEFKFSCDGGNTVKVGYYFKYSESAQKKFADSIASGKSPGDVELPALGDMMIRSTEKGSPWVPYASQESVPIRAALMCPEGHDISQIFPP